MNASRVDQPRTRPVALRTNTARSAESAPAATEAIRPSPPLLGGVLPARQHEVLHLLLALDVDDRPEQLTLCVGAAGVDAERLPEPVGAARLVDVPVQRERGLVALDHLADRRRADRHGRATGVLE